VLQLNWLKAKHDFIMLKQCHGTMWYTNYCWTRCGHSCDVILGRLSTGVFKMRTATGRKHFACNEDGVSQISILIIPNGVKVLSNANVVVWKQIKRENSSLPFVVRVSKSGVLEVSNMLSWRQESPTKTPYILTRTANISKTNTLTPIF